MKWAPPLHFWTRILQPFILSCPSLILPNKDPLLIHSSRTVQTKINYQYCSFVNIVKDIASIQAASIIYFVLFNVYNTYFKNFLFKNSCILVIFFFYLQLLPGPVYHSIHSASHSVYQNQNKTQWKRKLKQTSQPIR